MSRPDYPIDLEDNPSITTSTTTSTTTSIPQLRRRRQSSLVVKCFIVISLIINSVLLTLVILKWSPVHEDDTETSSNPTSDEHSGGMGRTVCFTCNHLGPEISSTDTLYDVIRLSTGNIICCLKGNSNITPLFQKIVHDQLNTFGHVSGSHLASRSSLYNVKGAHLYMTVKDSLPEWTSTGFNTGNTAFCSSVTCRGGNITIQEEGKYLVYSHVTVNNYRLIHTDSNLLHIIYRHNPDFSRIGTQKLLFSKSSPTGDPQQTSFVSAILQLRRKDVLKSVVTKDYYPAIDKRPFSNFFGVIKI